MARRIPYKKVAGYGAGAAALAGLFALSRGKKESKREEAIRLAARKIAEANMANDLSLAMSDPDMAQTLMAMQQQSAITAAAEGSARGALAGELGAQEMRDQAAMYGVQDPRRWSAGEIPVAAMLAMAEYERNQPTSPNEFLELFR